MARTAVNPVGQSVHVADDHALDLVRGVHPGYYVCRSNFAVCVPVLAMTLVCGVSFFLIAPYTFLSGAIPLSFGGKKGSAAAAGIIDGVGYMGAILSGAGVALVAQSFGWSGAFLSLAAIAVLTTLAAVAYLLNQEAARRASRDKPTT